jgi:hypothetical protein
MKIAVTADTGWAAALSDLLAPIIMGCRDQSC